jgi:catechol 2,3-dioxygenase-like lactoylglutathione lyase family enzyme
VDTPGNESHPSDRRARNSLDSADEYANIVAMNHLTGIHHTSFTVADLDRSLAFFRDRLGLEVVYTREIRADYFASIVGLPGCVVKAAMLRLPGAQHQIELFQYLTPPTIAADHRLRPCDSGSHHLAFLVTDLAGLCQDLRSHGAELLSDPIVINSGPNAGGCAVYVRDPNGILIELFQPPSRDPA